MQSDVIDRLQAKFRISDEEARGVAELIEQRLKRENDQYAAWLTLRVMMRLAESDRTKVVPVSLAFASGVPEVWVRKTRLRVKTDRGRREAAAVLGVSHGRLKREIDRSREFLGQDDRGSLSLAGGAEALKRASACKSWR